MVPAPYSSITVVPWANAMGLVYATTGAMSTRTPMRSSDLRVTVVSAIVWRTHPAREDRADGYSVARTVKRLEVVGDGPDGVLPTAAYWLLGRGGGEP